MVFEVAEFRVKEGMTEEFVAGTLASQSIFKQAPGFISLQLHQEVEDPLNFVIMVKWESIEKHIEMQNSDLPLQLREKIFHCLERPPKMRHTTIRSDIE